MSKLGIVGATALSLAFAIATPAFAMELAGVRGGGPMHVGSASVDSVVSTTDASYCAQRWAYYNPASGKYMDDGGEWRSCP